MAHSGAGNGSGVLIDASNSLYRPESLKTDGPYHTIELRVKGRKTS